MVEMESLPLNVSEIVKWEVEITEYLPAIGKDFWFYEFSKHIRKCHSPGYLMWKLLFVFMEKVISFLHK